MEFEKEEYNNFQLIGIITTFNKRLSKKDTIWGYGTITVGQGKYKKWLNITAFGEEICSELESFEACVVKVNGILSNGFGDKRYQTSLIVNTVELIEEIETETEDVQDSFAVSESDLPF